MNNFRNVGVLPFEEEDYSKFADKNCNKCYGRGFTGHKVHMGTDGKSTDKRAILLCKCIDLRALDGAMHKIVEKMQQEANKVKNKEKKDDKKKVKDSKKIEEKVNMVQGADKLKEGGEEKCT